jgi:hypothetical protein
VNYGELKTAVLGDSHRENYSTLVARFIQEGEALIRSKLEAYGLEITLTDAQRVVPNSPIYALPTGTTKVRYVIRSDGIPLDQVDENLVGLYRSNADPLVYVVRHGTLVIAGTPGAGSTFTLLYVGMPVALAADADTNTLLNDYPQLYIEAAQVYLYRRAQNYQSSDIAKTAVDNLVADINRKVKKMLGGARSANAYNVDFRSTF